MNNSATPGNASVASVAIDAAPSPRWLTFIQFAEPPLKADEYTVTVAQTTNTAAPNQFGASCRFAVAGERFSFAAGEIDSLFPPDLSNGEYDGVLPSVVLRRRTLPWERYLDPGNSELPWLAVVLFNGDQLPAAHGAVASDLITLKQPITVLGNDQLTGVGTLPADTFSYPAMNPLGYGETPDQACSVIDIDVAVYNNIMPSLADMRYLAHVRQVDTIDTVKNGGTDTVFSVVLGNRIAASDQAAHAFLVSLENMGSYLPGADGSPAAFPKGIEKVRLICYRSWRFTANTLGQNFETLLENLNAPLADGTRLSTLRFPAAMPDPLRVRQALAAQASGTLDAPLAQALVGNALAQGYVALNHEMRHADTSVAWFRGPCAPFPVAPEEFVSTGSADAANRYNPQTGLFDVSYGAAWQLGQLLALQNKQYANALFNWKKSVNRAAASSAEQAILQAALVPDPEGPTAAAPFAELLRLRADRLAAAAPLPEVVTLWLSRLKLLHNIPFSYLVPDEAMLPLESLRFFQLDQNWINYLIDGALSIGRTCSSQQAIDRSMFGQIHARANPAAPGMRRQRSMQRFASNPAQVHTGFLLRSQLVAGWPNVQINGYALADHAASELRALRLERIAPDCIICIFDGPVAQVAIHEPPEQLHCGIELIPAPYSTTLRALTGSEPGSQFLSDPKGGLPVAPIPMRADGQTLAVAQASDAILQKLNDDFAQNILPANFTSAEFALEMIKGVVKVNFNLTNPAGNDR